MIKKLTSGKATGSDAIAAEIYKHGGINLTKRLVQLFTIIWDSRSVPQDFKDASLVHIYKRKGDRAICDNHRGISLLCIAGKILARIMLNLLAHHIADIVLPESQCGFRAGRGTTDMIFAMRQIQEKCREQNQDLYMVFIDLTKAFDSVNRTGLTLMSCQQTLEHSVSSEEGRCYWQPVLFSYAKYCSLLVSRRSRSRDTATALF